MSKLIYIINLFLLKNVIYLYIYDVKLKVLFLNFFLIGKSNKYHFKTESIIFMIFPLTLVVENGMNIFDIGCWKEWHSLWKVVEKIMVFECWIFFGERDICSVLCDRRTYPKPEERWLECICMEKLQMGCRNDYNRWGKVQECDCVLS